MDEESLCAPEGLSKKYLKAAILLFAIVIGGLYFYAVREQLADGTQLSKQCPAQLKTMQTQLEDVIQSKNRMDKQLTDTRKGHNVDRKRFKIVMQSCFALSRKAFMCQNQFSRSQARCNRIRQDYDRLSMQLQQQLQAKNPM